MLRRNNRWLPPLLGMLVLFGGCAAPLASQEKPAAETYYRFVDHLQREVVLEEPPTRVIAAFGSYAELWNLSGGALIATTEDAVSERKMQLSSETQLIGTVKEPNLEMILAADPDFVLLSSDIPQQVALDETLSKAEIPHAYFKVDAFSDYLAMLKICTDINASPERYTQYGAALEERIAASMQRAGERQAPKILLIRSMSSKAKALKSDHMVGTMLLDLGAENIAEQHPSLLEELGMETIVQEDPQFIFVVTMGDSQKAIVTLENTLMKNPAWAELTAVKNGNFVILPKDLFQYKPNARWAESYEYLENILYPA